MTAGSFVENVFLAKEFTSCCPTALPTETWSFRVACGNVALSRLPSWPEVRVIFSTAMLCPYRAAKRRGVTLSSATRPVLYFRTNALVSLFLFAAAKCSGVRSFVSVHRTGCKTGFWVWLYGCMVVTYCLFSN